MTQSSIRVGLGSIVLLLLFPCLSGAQTLTPLKANKPSGQWSDEDRSISVRLQREGMRYETARAVLWTEKDGLTSSELKEFGNLVNDGITNIEKFMGRPFDRKAWGADKIEYYISREERPSHTTSNGKPAVFLRLDMVKAKAAPYLHETTHILASGGARPQWLEEGFASFVETTVSARYGGYNSYLFNWDKQDITEFAKKELTIAAGQKVLPLVGLNTPWASQTEAEKELSRAIGRDRPVLARAYYALSESFVTFLAKKIGIKKFVKIILKSDIETALKKKTGKTTEQFKSAWLQSI